jgi:peptidoglycan/LPS O-acetylase OafA/YrhL
MNNIYFKGLNSLRFYAAFAVVIHHMEQFKSIVKIKNFYYTPLIHNMGGLGVTFFFVLSGFLLTYLMLNEKQEFKKIDIKKFYMRRILRIWPLYFIIIFISFYIFPEFFNFSAIGFNMDLVNGNIIILFLLMMANVALIAYGPILGAEPLWSVSSEEHFYMVWPWMFNWAKINFRNVFILILTFNIIKVILYLVSIRYTQIWAQNTLYYLSMFRIDCMLVGALGAITIFSKRYAVLKLVYSRPIQISSFVFILMVYKNVTFFLFTDLIYSIFFVVIILNIATNQKGIVKLDYKITEYLGKISYGIYLYHSLIIALLLRYYFHNHLIGIKNNIFFMVIISIAVIIISTISYYLIEKPFLTLKLKYSKVYSGKI